METSNDRAVSSQKSLNTKAATPPSDVLNLLLADGSDMIVTANRDGIIQSVTDTVTDILGYTPAELIGRHMGGFVNPTEVEQAQEIFDNSLRVPGHRDPIERGLLHVDGTRRVCEVISTNLLHVPEVAAIVFHVRDISRRLVAQRRFRQMFETHPTATAYIPTNGRGVLANPAYAELFGWTVVQLQTINALDLAHPNSREAIRARIAAGGADGVSGVGEYEFLRADGSVFLGRVTMKSVDDPRGGSAFLVGVEDITAWRAMSRERDEATARLAATMNNSSDLIALINRDFTWTVNERANEVLGYALGMERQLSPFDVIHPDDRALAADALRETFEGSRGPNDPVEVRLLNSAGEAFLYEGRGQSVPELDGVVVTLRDIGEQRKTQAALMERERELVEAKAARDRAELEARLRQAQRLESTGRLAAGVAHDFTNLLGVVLNYVSVLERSELTNEQRADLAAIRDSSSHATDLAQRLLRFGRVETGTAEPFDLAEAATKMRDLLQTSFGRGRTLECTVDGPAWIHADRGQIEQVIMNLALNARDAIGVEGTVNIDVHPTTSSDRFSGDQPSGEESVVLVVSDDGCGMTKHVVDRAFDPFFTTKAHGMGTGLGLSVVDGIVAESAGAIEIESVEGQGTEVRVFWPRVVATGSSQG